MIHYTMAQDIAAYILGDHRESNGANPYLQAAADHSNTVNHKMPWKSGGGSLIFQILNNGTIGDYSIMIPSRYNPNRNVVAAVFERKTWKDLAASIKDERSISQHKNMIGIRDSKGAYVYYIIEGPLTYGDDTSIAHIPFKNLHAKLRSMSIKSGVHCWQTRDQEDTARFLVHIARDLVRHYRQETINFPLQEQQTINNFKSDVATLITKYKDSTDSDIKKIIADLIVTSDKLNDREEPISTIGGADPIPIVPIELTTRADVSCTDIIMQMWCAVPKVSSKTAPILMEKINLVDLICQQDTSSIKCLISNLSFASGMRLGDARADAIVGIAYEGDEPGRTSEAYDSHVKILSQIPGVSAETADIILRKFPMKVLCKQIKSLIRSDANETQKNLRSIVNQLSTVVKRNGSKLGLSVAQKIVDILSATPRMSELSHLVA